MFDDLSRSPMFMFSIVSTLFHGCTPQVPMVCQRFAEGIVWWPWTPVAIDPANGGSWGTWRTLGTRPTYHPSISQPEMAKKYGDSISIQVLLVPFMTLFIHVSFSIFSTIPIAPLHW